MSEPRVAVVSLRGTAHKPTCPAVAKLKAPIRSTFVYPWVGGWGVIGEDGDGYGVASCCGRYFRSKEIVVWAEEADDE